MTFSLTKASHDASKDVGFAELVEDLTARLQNGEAFDVAAYLGDHVEHAERLRELLPALRMLGKLSISGPGNLSFPPDVSEASLPVGTLGDFRILREVGRGGMGVVYEAEQISLGRRVALKVLPFAAAIDPRALQRFQNEARAAACLHHTNIVPVYSVGCERGVSFYAMQYIDGQSLAAVIYQLRRAAEPAAARAPAAVDPDAPTTAHAPPDGTVDPKADTEPAARQSTLATLGSGRPRDYFRRVAELGVQAAEALDHAHQLGIVHRDVKPGNLLLDGRGCVWVADFGLAHMQHGEASLTMTGDLIGTLRYMSPEQALAKRVLIDHRTDVYSLGATLYELLTLRPALTGKDRQELLRQIAFEEPTPPRRLNKAIPHELEIIVLKAMEKNPAERYATAQEMADDLRRFLDDKPIQARRPSWRQVATKWARRHRLIVWAASTVFFLAAVLGGVNLWYVEQRQAETERVVGEHLQRAADFQREEHWEEARQELGRAEERLAGGGPAALAERLRTLQTDAAMVADLDEAALQLTAGGPNRLDRPGADEAYAAAFNKRGMDLAALAPNEAATRVRDSAVRARLVKALDTWAGVRERLDQGGGERLLAVARLSDDDPWRQRLRDPAVRNDPAMLEELARAEKGNAQPADYLDVLASLLFTAGRTTAAESLLRRAQQRYPAEFWIHTDLALILVQSGPDVEHSAHLAEGIGCFRAALALRPQSALAHFHLGKALKDQGNLDDATAEYRTTLTLKPDFAEAYLDLGIIMDTQGNPEVAAIQYRKAIECKPNFVEAQDNLGCVLHNPDDAAAQHRKAIALNPQYAPAHYNLGIVLKEQGKLDDAATEYRKAIALNPQYAEAHCNLGNALNKQGKSEEAAAEYRKAIALKPGLPQPHINLGHVLKSQEKPEAAEVEYRKAITLKADLAEAHVDLGIVLAEQGKSDEANAEFQRAITLKPNLPEAHFNLGNLLHVQGKHDEAATEHRKAIAFKPDFADAHSNLGMDLHLQGKPIEAEVEYRKAITLMPDMAEAHNNLGAILLAQGKFDEAVAEHRKAIALDPKDAEAHNNLGNALKGKQQPDEAIQEYRRAIELKPKFANAHCGLGIALAEKQHLDEAIREFRRAIDFDPKFALAHNDLGIALRETGKLTESLDAFRQLHQLGSGQPGWPYPSAQWVHDAELLVKLDHKLAAILEGKEKPADDAERLALARLCQQPFKKLYAAASRFFAEAFAHDAKLAADLQSGDRYNAACTAALAGCGRGEDAPAAEADRTPLRAQALKWLQADMAAWKPHTKSLVTAARTQAVKALAHWREDDDLAGVRGADALAKLPDGERADWRKLWADLDALLPEKKP